jgi:signal transduction histidine kinase
MVIMILLVVSAAVFISIVVTHYSVLHSIISRIEKTGEFPAGAQLLETSLKPIAIVALAVLVMLCVTLLYMILISHRTAGPLYSLKKAMERIGEGDFSVRLKFRKNDEVHDVAVVFNKMVENLKKKYSVKKS